MEHRHLIHCRVSYDFVIAAFGRTGARRVNVLCFCLAAEARMLNFSIRRLSWRRSIPRILRGGDFSAFGVFEGLGNDLAFYFIEGRQLVFGIGRRIRYYDFERHHGGLDFGASVRT